ncbi:Uncharacterized protein TCM_043425 [Theobroma cacao]|uniref:Uncharacterized protein n=1 Tax=Theobroma cacao TaxID=3641 RepID=A0A061FPT2_THECC|nr:Uncharacterized protein TCM_043425 [Theobroma cacao]
MRLFFSMILWLESQLSIWCFVLSPFFKSPLKGCFYKALKLDQVRCFCTWNTLGRFRVWNILGAFALVMTLGIFALGTLLGISALETLLGASMLGTPIGTSALGTPLM